MTPFQLHFQIIASLTVVDALSRLVVPDNYNLSRMTEVTPNVVLWTSEVLINHKIFPKIPIVFLTYI